MSPARFRRIHHKQVCAMLYRAAWGDTRCVVFTPGHLRDTTNMTAPNGR